MRFLAFRAPAWPLFVLFVFVANTPGAHATLQQTSSQTGQPPAAIPAQPKPHIRPNDAGSPIPTRYDMLRGAYGPYRANNDLLYYHLDVRVDPDKQFLSGRNSIRFKMLKSGKRIQLDLVPAFRIDRILLPQTNGAARVLHYERAPGRTVYVDFPETLRKGRTYNIEFYYSGHPLE